MPEKGILPVLLALPAYGPCTCTVELSVLTLVVAPGTGVCVVLTEPFCPARPESGS